MKTLALCLAAVTLSFCAAARADNQLAQFDHDHTQFEWKLADLSSDLPSDWSSNEFLTIEFKASSPQRFELRLTTPGGVRSVRILPFPGAWIRAALPLKYFEKRDTQGMDLASLGNKPRAGYFINLTGAVGPLIDVQKLGVAMQNAVNSPTVEIRSVSLDKQSPGDAILEPKPLVDEFGQWIHDDWPGKAHSLDELKAAWREEAQQLGPGDFGYDQYGGYQSTQAKASGFFRVEQIDDRWWLIDPEGHYFFSVGADVMVPWMGTRTADRDGVFTALPPEDLKPPSFRANQSGTVSFYTWNLLRRFGSNWQPAWIDFTLRRMDSWGLNTIANWSDSRLGAERRKPYVVMLRGWGIETGYLGLPDVYADEFAKKVDAAAAQQCTPHKDDPWLLGYFVANEPPWPGRETEIVSAILDGKPAPIQDEAKKFLADGDTPQRRRDFVNAAIVRFIDTVNAALRKYDPNHLNLGLRFGSKPSEAMLRASRNFDVFSMNSYATQANLAQVNDSYRVTGKPVIIGEYHFGAPERGMACGIVQAKDQHERGVAYIYYVENAAANPNIIGTHWFQWTDEPNTGRFDGENYNIGLIDVTDRPYPELIDALKSTHRRLLDVHSGKEKPVTQKALVQ